jgi:C-terminal processing protease CtpA/Prc
MRIAILAIALLCSFPWTASRAQDATPSPVSRADLEAALSFESATTEGIPAGWRGSTDSVYSDRSVVHGGKVALRIERNASSANGFSTVTKAIPIDFAGSTVELRGYLRLRNVNGFAGLWLREDGTTRALAFENMQSRHLAGTSDWSEYSIKLPLHPDATKLYFGVLLADTGTVWADDLQLLVDGRPVWEARHIERAKSVLETDRAFDAGSGIQVEQLSARQVDDLVTLGKVWGFLKYHHPAVTNGKHHWDYELFRVLPRILAASNAEQSRAVLTEWVASLGEIAPCSPCAKLPSNGAPLAPDIKWISDRNRLGEPLSKALSTAYQNRAGEQFYVALQPGVGNAQFKNELAYEQLHLPDPGFQLLAVYRLWNIVEYWSPYRDTIGDDWDKVLRETIPTVMRVRDDKEYKHALFRFVAHIHDTHANLWNSLDARPPEGGCYFPMGVRFVRGLPVVSEIASDIPSSFDVQVGDTIKKIDGVSLSSLIESWTPFYAASNEPTLLRDIARGMTRGSCGEGTLDVERGKRTIHATGPRVPNPKLQFVARHDLPGEPFRLLSNEVAYLKLSSVKASEIPNYLASAKGTKGLIIDIRNYPSEFVVFALGSHLVDRKVSFARFTKGDLSNPGAFDWTPPEELEPQNPHYSGTVVILVDETSLSQAEYTAMALRASPHAIIVGSTTAGADGNVSPVDLPGGLKTMISGIGVFYPDKKPTQRIGIVPDISVLPTIEGIRDGRDEVLERALREILGGKLSAAELSKLYH